MNHQPKVKPCFRTGCVPVGVPFLRGFMSSGKHISISHGSYRGEFGQ